MPLEVSGAKITESANDTDSAKINLPKMACTPMTSVKNADPKVISMVTVMKNTVGPLSTTKGPFSKTNLEWSGARHTGTRFAG